MKINNFLALYGITNVGKTTQIDLLKKRCKEENISLFTQKYPVYDLEPTGPMIFSAIKGGNSEKLSSAEIQALMAKNRFDFQPQLEYLANAVDIDIVVAEMYTGTGVAYGIGDGVNKEVLLAINEGLVIPAVSILLDGERFLESIEKGHRFEEDKEKTERIRSIHLELAKMYDWHIINANQNKEIIHEQIWSLVIKILSFTGCR